MKSLGEFMSYILLAVFAQNILLDRAIGLDEIITAIGRKKLLPKLILAVSAYSSAGVMLTWLLSRFVSGQAAYILLAMMYLMLCGVAYFASDRLLLKISPEAHDIWAPILPHALINSVAVGAPLAVLAGGIPHWYAALGLGIGTGIGLALAVLIIQNGMDLLNQPDMPEFFRGTPALLIYIGILSLGFCAFL